MLIVSLESYGGCLSCRKSSMAVPCVIAGNIDIFSQMYDDAINGVQEHLVKKSMYGHFTYTSELIPERNRAGEM